MSDWAAKYEQMKKERLAKEAAQKNRNLGFSKKTAKDETNTEISDLVNQIPEEVVRPNVKEEAEDYQFDTGESRSTSSMLGVTVKQEVKTSVKVETSSCVEERSTVRKPTFSGMNSAADRPSQKHDPNDAWFAAYEAHKAAALKNLETKSLQSVSGASGFCGKIEGVAQHVSQNQVTKLMKKLKKEEKAPTMKFVDKTKEEEESKSQGDGRTSLFSKLSSPVSLRNPSPNTASSYPSDTGQTSGFNTRGFSNQTKPNFPMQANQQSRGFQSNSGNPPNTAKSDFGSRTTSNSSLSLLQSTYSSYSEESTVVTKKICQTTKYPGYGSMGASPVVYPKDETPSESAFQKRPPPPPSALLKGSFGANSDKSSDDSGESSKFNSPQSRPGRPAAPTPRRYGTQYGGAPSPGPEPSQAFQPPGFHPATPPSHGKAGQRTSLFQNTRGQSPNSTKSTDHNSQPSSHADRNAPNAKKFYQAPPQDRQGSNDYQGPSSQHSSSSRYNNDSRNYNKGNTPPINLNKPPPLLPPSDQFQSKFSNHPPPPATNKTNQFSNPPPPPTPNQSNKFSNPPPPPPTNRSNKLAPNPPSSDQSNQFSNPPPPPPMKPSSQFSNPPPLANKANQFTKPPPLPPPPSGSTHKQPPPLPNNASKSSERNTSEYDNQGQGSNWNYHNENQGQNWDSYGNSSGQSQSWDDGGHRGNWNSSKDSQSSGSYQSQKWNSSNYSSQYGGNGQQSWNSSQYNESGQTNNWNSYGDGGQYDSNNQRQNKGSYGEYDQYSSDYSQHWDSYGGSGQYEGNSKNSDLYGDSKQTWNSQANSNQYSESKNWNSQGNSNQYSENDRNKNWNSQGNSNQYSENDRNKNWNSQGNSNPKSKNWNSQGNSNQNSKNWNSQGNSNQYSESDRNKNWNSQGYSNQSYNDFSSRDPSDKSKWTDDSTSTMQYNSGQKQYNNSSTNQQSTVSCKPVLYNQPADRGSQAQTSGAQGKGLKRDMSFNQALRETKADSKKDSNSWQSEYEARKRARLAGKT